MSTQRYISTAFWDDEWVQSLNPPEKLLYLYYLTNPLTSISGIYKVTTKRVAFDTGFSIEIICQAMANFQKAKKAFRYGEWIILPKWPKHQNWNKKPTIKTGIDAALKEIPEKVIRYSLYIGYDYPVIGYEYRPSYSEFDSEFEFDLNNTSDPEIETQKEIPEETVSGCEAKAPPEISKSLIIPKPKDETDPLYNPIRESFLSKTRSFANYAKEGTATKTLTKYARLNDPNNPADFIKGIITKYFELIETGPPFWRKQPFTPSGMVCMLDRIQAEIKSQQPFEVEAVSDLSRIFG